MISMLWMTASCFSLLARKSVSVAPFTYDAISRTACRMSRSRPSWSASIHTEGGREDVFASEAIGRFLQGRTEDEIHTRANQLLRLARHFEQRGCGDRHRLVERHQQVHIAAGTCLATRR